MPRVKVKARNEKALKQIMKAFEETQIIQRQKQMIFGRWDFVVFGPAGKEETILREGYAEHARVQRAPIYIASLAQSGSVDVPGVPIGEFINEEVPAEYEGMEIIQIDPLRPLTITRKQTRPALSQAEDAIVREYESQNIAVLRAPRDADWVIAVMKYLNDCDRVFSDPVRDRFFASLRDESGRNFKSQRHMN